MKFRVPQIAMTADIEKAFLQVELSEVDRDATRFLWIKSHGAVAYLRVEQESGVQTTIVMAKSKITPMKSQTTPRLELLASLVAARLSHFISGKLKPKLGQTEITSWSDSEIVLHWLCSKKLPDSFVSRRIEEIKKLTSQHQWRFCPFASNPADLLSRGVAIGALVDECSIWWKGPHLIRSYG